MNTWYDNEKIHLDAASLGGETEYSSWAIVVTVFTNENLIYTGKRPVALKGWGYMFPPSAMSTIPPGGVGYGNGYEDKPNNVEKYACLPINWDKWTSDRTFTATRTDSNHIFNATNGNIPIWMCSHYDPGEIPADGGVACQSLASKYALYWDTVYENTLITYNPKSGDIGDAMGVYITNKTNSSYKPYAIRAATVVTSEMKIDFVNVDNPKKLATPGQVQFE